MGKMKKHLSPALLALTLILSGCGGTPQPPAPTEPSLTIGGQVTGSDLKLGNVVLLSAQGRKVAQAVVTQNAFTLDLTTVLPQSADLTGNLTEGCQGENSNPAARLLTVPALAAYSSAGDRIGNVLELATAGTSVTPNSSYVLRVYAVTATRFKGSCTSTSDGKTETDTLDITLKEGWNTLLVTPTTSGVNLTNAASDLQTVLRLDVATPHVVVDLKPSTLTLTGESVKAQAEFIQVGNYHGPVTVSTDLPGLTVEPLSLNLPELPRLSGQKLAAQSYQTELTFRYSGPEKQLDRPFTLLVRNPAGEVVGRGQGRLNVQRPSVWLTLVDVPTSLPLTLHRGEETTVRVAASGAVTTPVTVSLAGLPAGVSADPVTFTLTGGYGVATLTLRASADATLGEATVRATSPDSGGAMGPVSFLLSVAPERLALGEGSILSLTRSASGDLWGSGPSLVQVRDKQVVARTLLPGGVTAASVVIAPDGAVWAWGSDAQLYRLSAGTLKAFPAGGLTSTQGFGVDAQGRAWFISFDVFHTPQLQVLDPATGQKTARGEAAGTNGATAVVSDPSGQFVFYPTTTGELVRVNTATGETLKSGVLWLSSVGESVRQMRFDPQGSLWLATSGPRALLIRLNMTDLTVAKQVTLPGDFGYAQFAPENDAAAWFLTSEKVIRLSLSDGSVTERLAENGTRLTSLSTAAGGGVAYTYSVMGTQQFGGPSFLEYWR